MIHEICRDVLLLGRRAEPATKEDSSLGQDLLDTLRANRDRCVGMAANMIGVNRAVIAVMAGDTALLMYNPVLLGRSSAFPAEEGCLSLDGMRSVTRYRVIEVEYCDIRWKKVRRRFSGWTAQIIQHEMDHLDGILI